MSVLHPTPSVRSPVPRVVAVLDQGTTPIVATSGLQDTVLARLAAAVLMIVVAIAIGYLLAIASVAGSMELPVMVPEGSALQISETP